MNSSSRELQSQQFYATDGYLLWLANFICKAIKLALEMDHAAVGRSGCQLTGGVPGKKMVQFIKRWRCSGMA